MSFTSSGSNAGAIAGLILSSNDSKQRPTVKPQVLKGFRDYLPEQMLLRNQVIGTITNVFEKHGFEPLDTPALEHYEVLAGKAGENEKLMYEFDDQGGRHVGLRYDLTVPLARVVAMHQNEIIVPFKRYHIAPVWRAEKPQRGRFREFWQCDVDIAGSAAMNADAEVISVLVDALNALRLPSFVIHISHRLLLERVAVAAGIDESRAGVVYRSVDKLAKIGRDGVRAELESNNVPIEAAVRLLDLVAAEIPQPDRLTSLRQHLASDSLGLSAVQETATLLDLLAEMGISGDRYEFDLSLARGLDYYTGPVFEATVDEPKVGSVCGGGRYDGLVGTFLGRQVPATGLSLGLERLIEVVQEFSLLPVAKSVAQAIVVSSPETFGEASKIARDLRSDGFHIDLSIQPNRGFGDQLKYADRRGIPLAIIAGEAEIERGVVSVKVLASGEQFESTTVELSACVRKLSMNEGRMTEA